VTLSRQRHYQATP